MSVRPTFKLTKVMMSDVNKDVKVFMEELEESSIVMHFLVNNQQFHSSTTSLVIAIVKTIKRYVIH